MWSFGTEGGERSSAAEHAHTRAALHTAHATPATPHTFRTRTGKYIAPHTISSDAHGSHACSGTRFLRAVLLANVLGEWPTVALDDPSTFQKVELEPSHDGAAAAAPATSRGKMSGEGEGEEHSDDDGAKEALPPPPKKPVAEAEPQHTTSDMISQILSKPGGGRSRHPQMGTMHRCASAADSSPRDARQCPVAVTRFGLYHPTSIRPQAVAKLVARAWKPTTRP